MRAVRYERYGGPERLHLVELPTPEAGPGEVHVRVGAASLNSWDWDLLRGRPMIARLGGLFRPRLPVLGADVAGEVVAVGDGVTGFVVGDRVHGDLSSAGWGGFAEFVAAPASAFRRIPDASASSTRPRSRRRVASHCRGCGWRASARATECW